MSLGRVPSTVFNRYLTDNLGLRLRPKVYCGSAGASRWVHTIHVFLTILASCCSLQVYCGSAEAGRWVHTIHVFPTPLMSLQVYCGSAEAGRWVHVDVINGLVNK